MKRFKV